MKLWALKYSDEEGPVTFWSATKEGVLAKAVEVKGPVEIEQRTLPKGRQEMATWLNIKQVDSWR